MIDLPDSLSVFAFISMLMFVPLLLFCVGTSLKSKIYVSLVSIKKNPKNTHSLSSINRSSNHWYFSFRWNKDWKKPPPTNMLVSAHKNNQYKIFIDRFGTYYNVKNEILFLPVNISTIYYLIIT
jgi:hypothetical protein